MTWFSYLFFFLTCSIWNWKGYSIRYQYSGNNGPALVLVHGFGANRFIHAVHILFL